MPTTKTRKITVASAKPVKPVAAKAANPVSTVPAVAVAKAGTNSNVAADTAKAPRAKRVNADGTAKPVAGVTRTAATIAAQRTNFGNLSDRDNAYLAFFASFAKRDGGNVTLPAIVQSNAAPDYAGSAKPHDAGVIVRLGKAGLISHNADCTAFTFTKAGQSLAVYTATKARS